MSPHLPTLALLCLAPLVACGGAAAPLPSFVGLDGEEVDPMPGPGERAVVWVFVTTDCPIANGYAPEVQAIADEYGGRGVRVLVIHVDAVASDSALRAHADDYGYRCGVVADGDHLLVRYSGATVTPEVAVYGAEDGLVYRGRIDDRHMDLGRRRPAATTHELRDALDALLDGRPIETSRTTAVGCLIEAPSEG